MRADEKLKLVVYDGDYALPSLDVECTKSIVYTVATQIPVQIKLLNSLKQCIFYSQPHFIHGNLHFKTFGETVLYLRTLNYNLDAKLNAKQCCESLALTNFVQCKLRPVLEFVLWVDQRNSDEFTSAWFMKALPIPFNYWHVNRLKQRANNFMETLYPTEANVETIREYLSKTTVECLSSLSTRLEKSDYFFGSFPTSLDVVVYSYIAPLVKLPFPSNDISNLVSMWPNLVNLVKRIDGAYFPNAPKGPKYLNDSEKVKTSDDDVSYVAILILTISATSLALGFAFSKGIVPSKALMY